MLRFSRYFFVLFLLVTVLPLVILVVVNQYSVEQIRKDRLNQALEIGVRTTETLYLEYLETETQHIDETIASLPSHKLPLDVYKQHFRSYKVGWLSRSNLAQIPEIKKNIDSPNNPSEIVSFYSLIHSPQLKKPQLVSVFSIPVQFDRLLLVRRVPIGKLVPPGPFVAKVYDGSTIDKNHLIATRLEHHTHKRRGFFRFLRHNDPHQIEPPPSAQKEKGKWKQYISKRYKTISIDDPSGDTVVTIALHTLELPKNKRLRHEQSQTMAFAILFTGIVFSLIAGFYLKKNFVDPLAKLSFATDELKTGNFNVSIHTNDIKQPDVKNTLERFNQMVIELSEKEQLRENFITNLTHDFRTPLIAQERSLELLSKEFDQLNLPEQSQLSKSLVKNNQHLLRMVNQLLETYQFEAGQVKLDLKSVNLSSIVDQCIEQLTPLAQERNIHFSQTLSPDMPAVYGDDECLKRVFLNLIGNAIDHIPKGSHITISGTSKQNHVEIHVQDNGPGIDPKDQAHLFDRYYAGMSTNRKIGSGLGLYICRMLIEAHQGSIMVDSKPGQYTDFIVTLPLDPNLMEA